MGVADLVNVAGLLLIGGQQPFTITSTRFIRRLPAKASNLQGKNERYMDGSISNSHFRWKLFFKYHPSKNVGRAIT